MSSSFGYRCLRSHKLLNQNPNEWACNSSKWLGKHITSTQHPILLSKPISSGLYSFYAHVSLSTLSSFSSSSIPLFIIFLCTSLRNPVFFSTPISSVLYSFFAHDVSLSTLSSFSSLSIPLCSSSSSISWVALCVWPSWRCTRRFVLIYSFSILFSLACVDEYFFSVTLAPASVFFGRQKLPDSFFSSVASFFYLEGILFCDSSLLHSSVRMFRPQKVIRKVSSSNSSTEYERISY